MKRTLLLVSGGIEAIPGIRRAQELGWHVVVSDGSDQAPGLAVADDRLIASTYDWQATVAAARRYHKEVRSIDGVSCVAADVPLTVARVAEALDLPGIPVSSAELAMDKLAMKDCFAADAVPIPWYCAIDSLQALEQAMHDCGPDLVIKPVDSRGARGVLRLGTNTDLGWAYDFAHAESPSGRVMVERYLAGPQVSTESLVLDGIAHTPGFSDRNYALLDRYAPHMIEDGGDLPGHLPDAVREQVYALVQRAAASMGIRNGVVKGDIVIHEGIPKVIEVAARLSGGYFCSHEIPLHTGVDFLGQALRLAMGERIDAAELTPRFHRPVCQRYLFPRPGRVRAIEQVDEVSVRPGIELCEIRVQVGDRIGPVHSHPARAGVIIATGDTPDEARKRATDAVRDIRIEISDDE